MYRPIASAPSPLPSAKLMDGAQRSKARISCYHNTSLHVLPQPDSVSSVSVRTAVADLEVEAAHLNRLDVSGMIICNDMQIQARIHDVCHDICPLQPITFAFLPSECPLHPPCFGFLWDLRTRPWSEPGTTLQVVTVDRPSVPEVHGNYRCIHCVSYFLVSAQDAGRRAALPAHHGGSVHHTFSCL